MNRFTQPLQSPTNFKPYELPFEQMVQTLGIAEQQNDAARSGVFEILDFEFPYIPTQSNQIAYETIKQDIGEGVDGMLQGNTGDLRGLRGNILNMQRGLKNRATRKDGDIYKLSSDYANYKAWEETNAEVAKTNPTRYMQYKTKYLEDLENKGGSLSSSFNGEAVLATPDWSKKVKEYTSNIQADLIKEAQTYNAGINIVSWEDIKKYVSPQRIMEVAVGYLGSDPEVMEYFMQDIRNGFRTEENSQFIISRTGQDGKVIRELNSNNPATNAIRSAMIAQGFMEHSRSNSVKYDATAYQIQKDKDAARPQMISFGISAIESLNTTQQTLQQAIESGDANAIKTALATAKNDSGVTQINENLKNDPIITTEYNNFINSKKGTDKNGKVVTFEDYLTLISMTKGTLTFENTKSILENLDYNFEDLSLKNMFSDFFKRNLGGPSRTEYAYALANKKLKSESTQQMNEVLGFRYPNSTEYNNWEKTHITNQGAGLYFNGMNLNNYIAKNYPNGKLIQVNVDTKENLTNQSQLIAVVQDETGQMIPLKVNEATNFSNASWIHDQQSFSNNQKNKAANESLVNFGQIVSYYQPEFPTRILDSPKNGTPYVNNIKNSGVDLIYYDNKIVPKYQGKIYHQFAVDKNYEQAIMMTHDFIQKIK